MKNKVFASFDEAIGDIFDGAVIAHSSFGVASQALNLWDALSRKDVKDLTIIGNMLHPRMGEPQGPHLPHTYGPIDIVYQPGKVKRIIAGFTSHVSPSLMGFAREYDEVTKGMEVIPVSFGSISLRLEAAACGYGGILSPVGVGTFMEDRCQKVTIDGKQYLIEKPLCPDFGFVKAWKADKLGNLVYHLEQRVHNPVVARASKVTIAEVQEIVEVGEIDPDQVHTPHIYVDRIVKIPLGGVGSREWQQVNKALSFGPGSTRRRGMPPAAGQPTTQTEVHTIDPVRAPLVRKYNTTRLDRQTMGMRIAKEFRDGDCVNLGKGIPTTAADYVDPSMDIYYHAEPGLLGYGSGLTMDEWELIDPDLHDAAIRHVRPKAGMAVFDMVEAFNMLRGHHVDAGVIGGFQVSQKGDFANWTLEMPVPHSGISIGGGFDLAVGPKRCIVALTHLDPDGRSKIVRELTYPLTGAPNVVDLVVTDLAVIEVVGPKGSKEGMVLKEYAPGWTVEEIQGLTEADLKIAPDLKAIEL